MNTTHATHQPEHRAGHDADHGEARRPSTRSSVAPILKALVFPVYFVVVFSFCYISAFHAPTPHDAPIAVTGNPQVAQRVAAGIASTSDGAFDVRTVPSPGQARRLVSEREVVGALVVDDRSVTSLTAGGGGSAVASTVASLGTATASQLGTTATEQDLAPLTSDDGTGTALFYFIIVCTIGGYLTVTVLFQGLPSLSRGRFLATLGAMSVFSPLAAGAISTIFVGTLGAGLGQVLAVLGIAAVYTFTVGCIAYALNKLFGRLAIMVVLLLVVFVNFPSAGGGIPAALLPGFWQVLHEFWFGASAVETVRSVVYFPDASLTHYLVVLGAWLVVGLTAALLVPRSRGGSPDPGAESGSGAAVAG